MRTFIHKNERIVRRISIHVAYFIILIYTNVHFCAAVFAEKQAGQRVDFPVPVGASDGCVFQNPLYGFKIAAADNRLMHIFCDVPLAPVYIVVMFISERCV